MDVRILVGPTENETHLCDATGTPLEGVESWSVSLATGSPSDLSPASQHGHVRFTDGRVEEITSAVFDFTPAQQASGLSPDDFMRTLAIQALPGLFKVPSDG